MASPRIYLIHALRDSIAPANAAMAKAWPEARVANLLDDSLSADLAASSGRLDDTMIERFRTLARYAAGTAADGILFTCSAFGRAIEAARDAVAIPVLKPNEAALDAALDAGSRIALLVTFPATIPSMTQELELAAKARGMVPTIMSAVADGALAALQNGDGERHDRLIGEAARRLAGIDALVLAQFSMARAAPHVGKLGRTRLLTTPDSAVARLRRLVEARR